MDKEILVLRGHAIDLRVNNNCLKIRDGFPAQGDVREFSINKALNSLKHLVILGQSGSLSFEAIQWMMYQNVLISFLDKDGHLLSDLVPNQHVSGITKRRQATAEEPLNIQISAWLLAEKLKLQRSNLSFLKSRYHKASWWTWEKENKIHKGIEITKEREKQLKQSQSIEQQRVLEAQSAAAYWQCLKNIPLLWAKTNKVPPHWLSINARTSIKTKSPQKATDPFNACLNYMYAVLATKLKQACLQQSIDPDFGIIHADHATRGSLIYDLIEPLRPKIDQMLLEWFLKTTLFPKDFFETREGICRISPHIAGQVIPLVGELDHQIKMILKKFSGYFKDSVVRTKPVNLMPVDSKDPKKPLTLQDRLCLECEQVFMPTKDSQKFCCDKHRTTYTKRLLREKRIVEGKCPQCGHQMEEKADGVYKEKVSYCQKCSDYWKQRYRGKRISR